MPNLKNKTARARLQARSSLYAQTISPGRALGYRKRTPDAPGRWLLRIAKDEGGYAHETLGVADDLVEADGKQVLSYEQALKAALDRTSIDPAKITVAAALKDWADWKAGEATDPARVPGFYSTAERIAGAFPNASLRTLTTPQIDAWMEADTRAGRATKNRLLNALKAALTRAAERHGYTGPRAWEKAKRHSRADSFGRRLMILTEEEEDRLIAASPPDVARLLRAMQYTGARFGELKNAKVGDLHGDRLRLDGKTGERTIPLSDRKAQFFRQVAGNRPDEEPMFTRANGNPWRDTTLFKPLAKALAAVELPEGVTSYAFRHGFISRSLAQGVPVVAVAQYCGTSVKMIEQTYAKFVPTDLKGWFA